MASTPTESENGAKSRGLERLVDEIEAAARAAQEELEPLADELAADSGRYEPHLTVFQAAWSGSNLGDHSVMYRDDLKPPPAGQGWSKEWGFLHQQSGWAAVDRDEVIRMIEEAAGLGLDDLDDRAKALSERIRMHHDALVLAAARVPKELAERVGLDERRKQLDALDEHTPSAPALGQNLVAGQHMSRDTQSLHAGLRLAPHQTVEVAAMAAFAVADRARGLYKEGARAAATAEGLRHLPVAPQRSAGSPVEVGESRVDRPVPSDRLTVSVTATAVFLVLVGVAVGAGVTIAWADSHVTRATSQFAPWSLLRAAAGGVGVLAVVLALSTVWYGLVRGHADHVRMTLGPPLAWAAATGLGGALLIVFGIG